MTRDDPAARVDAMVAAVGPKLGPPVITRRDVVLVDLREKAEREWHVCIPGALHAPYPGLAENIAPGGMLHELATATGKRLVFFCAFGERSAMAVQAAQDAGLRDACHVEGGMGAWRTVASKIREASR